MHLKPNVAVSLLVYYCAAMFAVGGPAVKRTIAVLTLSQNSERQ